MNSRAMVVSTGSYLPDNVIPNQNLKQFPARLLPLIEQKTGVKSRNFAGDLQCTSDLGIIAANRCLARIGFDPEQLQGIIMATSTPDRMQPATATRVQHAIGATRAFAFDINSVCSGGVFSLAVADTMIRSGFCQNVLVVAAEIYSKILDPADFSTYPYFGDGAGAVLLEAGDDNARGVIHSILKTDGSKADIIQVPGGGTMLPFKEIKNPKDAYFKMIGKEVFNFATDKGTEVIREIIQEAGIKREDIDVVISHQANINIIKELSLKLEINFDKFMVNLDKYGNTAAASVLITLDELYESQKVEKGNLIILVAFGGGLSWGANLIRV